MKTAMLVFALCALMIPVSAMAEEAAEISAADAMFTVNNVWMMVATFLVFIMHLGFACVETGLTRAKNTVNILFKNTAIIAIGLLTYEVRKQSGILWRRHRWYNIVSYQPAIRVLVVGRKGAP